MEIEIGLGQVVYHPSTGGVPWVVKAISDMILLEDLMGNLVRVPVEQASILRISGEVSRNK